MTGKVGGSGSGPQGPSFEDVGAVSGISADQEARGAGVDAHGGPASARRTGRPKSDAFGSSLQAELETRLAAAGGEGAGAPSGAADAQAIESLMTKGDSNKVASEVVSRFGPLIENARKGASAPRGDPAQVKRFEDFIAALRTSGKLTSLRFTLDRSSQSTLEFYVGQLVEKHCDMGAKSAWGPQIR